MSYRVVYTRQAQKDARKLRGTSLARKVKLLLEILADDPFRIPPPCEKLLGDLEGAFSRRINIQHRLVYQVIAKRKIVKVLRMWTHYGP